MSNKEKFYITLLNLRANTKMIRALDSNKMGEACKVALKNRKALLEEYKACIEKNEDLNMPNDLREQSLISIAMRTALVQCRLDKNWGEFKKIDSEYKNFISLQDATDYLDKYKAWRQTNFLKW